MRWQPLRGCWLSILTSAQLVMLAVPAIAQGTTVFPSGAAPAAAAPDEREAVARLARRIVRDLEARRTEDARIDADLAVKRFPASALLRLRRAQAMFSVALQLDSQFAQVAEEVTLSRALDYGLRLPRHPPPARLAEPVQQENSDHARQMLIRVLEKVLTPKMLATIQEVQEQTRRHLKESGLLLEQRTRALQEAMSELQEARRLGDDGVEGALTGLWTQVVPLLWRRQREDLSPSTRPGAKASPTPQPAAPPPSAGFTETLPLAGVERALASFSEITPESVLRGAAAVAKQHPEDTSAMAGAADVITVVAALNKTPDPLREHIRALLEHRYLKHPERYSVEAMQSLRTLRRQLYQQLRDAKDTDVVRFPAAVAMQLYDRALMHDKDDALRWLRLRVYIQRVVFEPERAQPLLEELAQKEPGNAVVPLERARLAFMLDDEPTKGMVFLRQAARLPEFSRSYLVSVPAPLRPALKFHRGLRELVGKGWPGYSWLFNTLIEMAYDRKQVKAHGLLPQADELTEETHLPLLQIKLTGEQELTGLHLRLAELFCQAPDYPDQLEGINEKANALDFLIKREKLLPEQQEVVRRLEMEHQRAFADYPSARSLAEITPSGLKWHGSLGLLPGPSKPELPRLLLMPNGAMWTDEAGGSVTFVR
jgi:hypothetical protein